MKCYGRKERGWTEEYADEGSNRGVRKGVNGRGIEKRAGGSVRDVGRTRERVMKGYVEGESGTGERIGKKGKGKRERERREGSRMRGWVKGWKK